MQVDILGPVRVRDGDDAIDLGGPRSRALVARLALEPGRAVGVDGLVDALWGADVPSDAHNALQSVVSRTRRRLPDGVLRSGAGGYALDLPADAVDAHRFERLVREGRPHDALALWRGEALGDVRGAAFADIAAARLDELRLGAVESRIERDLEAGRIDRGRLTAEAEELAAAHPYRETIWALLMRTLVADGRQADALGAYERMRAGLADELGIDPSAGLQDLHLAILRGDPALTMPGTGKPVAPTNLRTALTSFVGRADAVDQIRALLGE
ncbi:MAG: AfsR/SARP family transcriptional regulator, partial [Nocardioidaceae bacterium]